MIISSEDFFLIKDMLFDAEKIFELLGPDNPCNISNSLLFPLKIIPYLISFFPLHELYKFRENNIWREEVSLEISRRSKGFIEHQFILGLSLTYQEKATSYEPGLTLDSLVKKLNYYEVLREKTNSICLP